MTKEEFDKLAKKTSLTSEEFNSLSPKELSRWEFLNSQNTKWADPYGGVVPYYPQTRHIEKNLAPEKDLSRMQLEALAQANQIARHNGLMSHSLADKMLPTTLIESATGINSWGYPDTPKYRNILIKAGLPPTLEEINNMDSSHAYDRELRKTKLMHAVMAAKAAQYGEDQALERWNGKGKGMGGMADSVNHLRKVHEADALLKHPKNKELMDVWSHYSNIHNPKTGVKEELRSLPKQDTWSDKNVPSILNAPANAIEGGIKTLTSANPLQKLQEAVRNWTAPEMPSEYFKE